MEEWEKRDCDKNLIRCVGEDRKIHVCYPWENKCYCGENVLSKKPHDVATAEFSCYECTY